MTRSEAEAFYTKWLADLRSGKYARCEYVLKRDTPYGPGFCPLGIALLSAGYEVATFMEFTFGPKYKRIPPALQANGYLAHEVMRINDKLHFTFEMLAAWLEKEGIPKYGYQFIND